MKKKPHPISRALIALALTGAPPQAKPSPKQAAKIAQIKEERIRKAAGMVCGLLLFLAPCASAATLAELKADAARHHGLLDRIEQVESHGNRHAVGDNGKARGSFQCWRSYWADARAECPELPTYEAGANDPAMSRLAVCSVWRKYRAKTDRERALCHHYGSNFRRIPDRHLYCRKCGV